MATVKHHKVVASLPADLEPDAIYYVRAGQGHDVYVTNGSGMIVGYPANAALGLAGKVDKAEGQSLMTDAERAKLSGIEVGATANATDAQLRDRATHTGTQAIDTVSGLQAALDEKIDTTERGVSGGVATLDEYARIPPSQLPSYVDDVLEFLTRDDFPATGEGGKIYIAINQGTAADPTRQYRWTGSVYAEINPSPGTTDALAEGSTNPYFREHRVRNTVLTGLSLLSSAAVTAADTVLSAFGKLQAQLNSKISYGAPLISNHTGECYTYVNSDLTSGATIYTNIPAVDTVMPNIVIRGAMGGYTEPFEARLSWYFYMGAVYIPNVLITATGGVSGMRFYLRPENGKIVIRIDYGALLYVTRLSFDVVRSPGAYDVSVDSFSGWTGTASTTAGAEEVQATAAFTMHTRNFDPSTKQDKSALVTTATSRTLALIDAWNLLRPATTGAITLTVPTNAAVAFEIGTEITIRSVGNITLDYASGVVLEPQSGGTLNMTARMTVTLKKVAANEWIVIGQTVAA
ncbi:hypothetical protein [Stutzerimonas nitrititolerans]|uniref:hypothetical protein n=1 Tax=Stutzerimonas nitrititolerans TaxID=2482751 RepID=UPI0028B05D2D|nr:hypothetical protein [Stutzerimonas nitrititolerans]